MEPESAPHDAAPPRPGLVVDAAFLDLLPIAVHVCDAGGRILRHNRQAAALWGRHPDPDELWCGAQELRWPDGRPLPIDHLPRRVLETGEPVREVELQVVQPDGRRHWALANIDPIRGGGGDIVGLAHTYNDITVRKAAETARTVSERRLRQLTELSPSIVWFGDRDGRVSYLSPRWSQYTGKPESAGLGEGWRSVFHPDDLPAVETAWRAARDRGALFEAEARLRRADGAWRWFLIRA